jgi:hypothetical protein
VESPSRLAELAPHSIPLVMSSAAWEAYAVEGSPYFAFIDGAGLIAGEGSAQTWPQVKSLFRDFLFDIEMASRFDFTRIGAVRHHSVISGRVDDAVRDDASLLAAGIDRGHPSLNAPFHESGSDNHSQEGGPDVVRT